MKSTDHLRFLLVLALTVASAVAQVHFKTAATYDTGGANAGAVAIADLRGNGKLDLVAANGCQSINQYGGCVGNGEVAVLLGNGDGTFQPAVTYSTGAYFAQTVAVGDVNRDGKPDLVVADWCQEEGCSPDVGAVSVLLGNGDGTFQPPVVYNSGDSRSLSVALGELRGNGKLDLVVSNTYFGGIEYEGSVSVLLGNGDGTFQPPVSYGTGGKIAASVVIGDLNGDSHPDLLVAEFGEQGGDGYEGGVGVLLGNGDGTFRPVVTYGSGGDFTYSVTLGDLRGNGILDAVAASRWRDHQAQKLRGGVSVLLGNADGSFQPAVSYNAAGVGVVGFPAIGPGMDSLAIADVNGDGHPDLVAMEECQSLQRLSCVGTGEVNVMLGNGDGTLQAPVAYSSSGYGGSGIAIADLNGDGRPDLVAVSEQTSTSNYDGLVAVLLNKTSYKTTTALTSSLNPSHINQAVTFTATITSILAIPNGETVTFYAGSTKLGKATTTNGTATLTTSFAKANTYAVKAKYPGDTWHKPSSGAVSQVVNP